MERAILPDLTFAPLRVLKIAHHGSRTSTAQVLISSWQPDMALISAARGNSFGHPVPEVIERLMDADVQSYRTDRDGQITLETDGQLIDVPTWGQGAGRSARRRSFHPLPRSFELVE